MTDVSKQSQRRAITALLGTLLMASIDQILSFASNVNLTPRPSSQ